MSFERADEISGHVQKCNRGCMVTMRIERPTRQSGGFPFRRHGRQMRLLNLNRGYKQPSTKVLLQHCLKRHNPSFYSGFCNPILTSSSSYFAFTLLSANSRVSPTSLAPRGIISASYASMASLNDFSSWYTPINPSTTSLASFRALLRPWPRSVCEPVSSVWFR